MINNFLISEGHVFLTLRSNKIWYPLHFQYFYFKKVMSRCKLRLMCSLLPCLERCSYFLDEDIKNLNGSYNTLDGKYFSGKGVETLRNNISAAVRGCFLYVLTHPSTDVAALQLSTLHWQRTLSMEKSPFNPAPPQTFLWVHWNLLWTWKMRCCSS